MSFLKQLLKPFVEFDENQPPTTPSATPSTAPARNPVPPAPAQTPAVVASPGPATPESPAQHPLVNGSEVPTDVTDQVPVYSPSGTLVEPLPEHVQYFDRLIEDANRSHPLFQGTDYKEFVDSKVDIDDITDEALKYRMAYNVLKSTGLTKEKLLSTGQEYLNLIGRDLNAYQSAYAQRYQQEVGQKEALVQKKAAELQQLAQQINVLKAEINHLTQEATVTRQKLDATKNSFLLAGERKQNEIQSELQKIAGYF